MLVVPLTDCEGNVGLDLVYLALRYATVYPLLLLLVVDHFYLVTSNTGIGDRLGQADHFFSDM